MFNVLFEFMPFLFILIFVVVIMIISLTANLSATSFRKLPQRPKIERGTLTGEHTDAIGRHLIRHDDPEEGFVILNGVKRRIEDCKYL